MSPTLRRGDWIVVRRLDQQGQQAVQRQDIVLFRFPLGTAGRATKRVVAIGGDRVAIANRTVAVNGRVVPIAGAPSSTAARRRVESVPAGYLFLVGDNAAVSIDSRSFGAVPETEVVGRVWFGFSNRTLLIALIVTAAVALIAAAPRIARRRRREAV